MLCTNYTKTEYTNQIFGLGGVTCIAIHDDEDDRSNPAWWALNNQTYVSLIILLIPVITYYRGLFYKLSRFRQTNIIHP